MLKPVSTDRLNFFIDVDRVRYVKNATVHIPISINNGIIKNGIKV